MEKKEAVEMLVLRIILYFWDMGSKRTFMLFNFATATKESKKLSALLFFQFIYTKVGGEHVRHFSI
jgi:hypothetical protein